MTKIFANTATVSPMHVFYTSNEKLFKHKVPGTMSHSGFSLSYWSQADAGANPSQLKKRQAVSAENLEAIRSRFLEMYCFNTPKQEQKDLDAAGTFTRENFICGMFDRALETLERYSPDAFHSLHLPAYVLSALSKNLNLVENVMCSSKDDADAENDKRDDTEEARRKEEEGGSNPEADQDLADLDEPLFGVLKEALKEEPGERKPDPEPEKSKSKPKDCRQNHRQRVALLRQKYNLTFL